MSQMSGNSAEGSSKQPLWLLAHSTTKTLAKSIAEQSVKLDRNRTIEFKDNISWDHFDDGFPNIFIHDVKAMVGRDVLFLASLHKPSLIFEQMSLIHSVPRYLAKSFTVLLPYFPCGTMERVDREGQIATAMSVARMLSSTPLTRRGPSQLVIFDIHALQERFYFADTVIPLLTTAMPLLYPQLQLLREAGETVAIAFPDEGAFKRFHTCFSVPQHATDIVTCLKVRDGCKRVVRVKDGDPSGKHVVIVDDLVQTGGTLLHCAEALRNLGATAVSAYVPHAIFPNESWRRFLGNQFTNFWITDSLPHAADIAKNSPFRLISLASCIAELCLTDCYG